MQTDMFPPQPASSKPTADEIISFIKSECDRTGKRVSQPMIRKHFEVHRNALQTEIGQAYSQLKAEGWVPVSGRGGGIGPGDWVRDNPNTQTKSKMIKIAPTRLEELTELELEVNLAEQQELCKDMYYNHVKGIFDDIRSSLSDERLSEFHPEIEEFLDHTKNHLIGVINKL